MTNGPSVPEGRFQSLVFQHILAIFSMSDLFTVQSYTCVVQPFYTAKNYFFN